MGVVAFLVRVDLLVPVLLFLKSKKMLFGYFDPQKIVFDVKINNFRGELTDISA